MSAAAEPARTPAPRGNVVTPARNGGGKLRAIWVREPGMKIGILLSSDGTLVNRWVHAAAMPREEAYRIAAQIRAEGDEVKVVPSGPKPQRRRCQ